MSIRFDPEDLKEAALERINTARRLFDASGRDGSDLSACIYVAGVAVECMLRAYRLKVSPRLTGAASTYD
jgi:hypothetical protein